jgi:A1 cistron-splicing factor AAR2
MAQYFDPKPLEMSQEDAKVLFRSGGVVLFMNVPERTEVGMDYNAWQVGPRFKGIKMIPPGVHFLYYRCAAGWTS